MCTINPKATSKNTVAEPAKEIKWNHNKYSVTQKKAEEENKEQMGQL